MKCACVCVGIYIIACVKLLGEFNLDLAFVIIVIFIVVLPKCVRAGKLQFIFIFLAVIIVTVAAVAICYCSG